MEPTSDAAVAEAAALQQQRDDLLFMAQKLEERQALILKREKLMVAFKALTKTHVVAQFLALSRWRVATAPGSERVLVRCAH
jgi:hypothetical protein